MLQAEGGPYQEYFYMELPYLTDDGRVLRRKMVYLHESSGDNAGPRFLMSLGSEIVAHIIEQPTRAFWKNCLLDEGSEEALVERFRGDFAPYDPALLTSM